MLLDEDRIEVVYTEKNDMTFVLLDQGEDAPKLLGYYFGDPDNTKTIEVYRNKVKPKDRAKWFYLLD